MIAKYGYGVFKPRKSQALLSQPQNCETLINDYRIRSAKILLITLKALANEVAKNLVLAGIGSLVIIDHETVTEEDLSSQFFVSEGHVGQNVCLAKCPPFYGKHVTHSLLASTGSFSSDPEAQSPRPTCHRHR